MAGRSCNVTRCLGVCPRPEEGIACLDRPCDLPSSKLLLRLGLALTGLPNKDGIRARRRGRRALPGVLAQPIRLRSEWRRRFRPDPKVHPSQRRQSSHQNLERRSVRSSTYRRTYLLHVHHAESGRAWLPRLKSPQRLSLKLVHQPASQLPLKFPRRRARSTRLQRSRLKTPPPEF